jgi:CheY-like chemotaxis protein
MPKGGRLILSTSNVILDADYVSQNSEVTAGPYVCIDVTDSGGGIEPEILSRVFEPFFTTKEVGKGTGLGLAMVYGFIKQSKGHIKIYSEVGYGTSIKLYLPQYADGVVAGDVKEEKISVVGGGERILMVEDNDEMRLMAARQLEGLGYSVISVANGKEALAHIQNGAPFDLLFSDIVMPGTLSGFDIARAALTHNPAMPILLTSGFPGSAVDEQREILGDHSIELLGKPYRKSELAQKIRETLDRAKARA